MKRYLSFFAALWFMVSYAFASETTVAEEQAKRPRLIPQEAGKLSLSSYYDYGWVHLDSKTGKWGVSTTTLSYTMNDHLTPYLEISALDRFHQIDYTYNTGTYIKFKDLSSLRAEIGFGSDITYVYRFQTRLEYAHRLSGSLFWQTGYRYLNYADNDVFIGYPGLIYYFGDNYVTAFYNVSHTESRGNAQWGTVKGNFALNDRVSLWLGQAIGQRLYDIELLPASKQYGYIIFCGVDFKLTRALDLQLGYSYSMEKPDFIKRSLEFGLSSKF